VSPGTTLLGSGETLDEADERVRAAWREENR